MMPLNCFKFTKILKLQLINADWFVRLRTYELQVHIIIQILHWQFSNFCKISWTDILSKWRILYISLNLTSIL